MGSLRYELQQADMHGGKNTIVFHLAAPAAHTENVITLTSGVLSSKGDVTIIGPGAGKLIVNGNSASGVFSFDSGTLATDSPVSISGLSIVNGDTAGKGGGIYSIESLTLKSVVISGNTSADGGGVYVGGSTGAGTKVNISNSLISGNDADRYGGGLFIENLKSISISNSVVTGNTAFDNNGGGLFGEIYAAGTGFAINRSVFSGNTAAIGGGLFVESESTSAAAKISISGTKIIGNAATSTGAKEGGGLFIGAGNTVISGSSIEANKATYYGGGINAESFAALTISGSTVSGNQTTKATLGGGGGIFINGNASSVSQPVKIAGSVIGGNVAGYGGGGLYTTGDIALSISGSTISDNQAIKGGGIMAKTGTGGVSQEVKVAGSLFADNSAGSDGGGLFADLDIIVAISGSTFHGDTAGTGGGLDTSGSGSIASELTVTGSNFSNNDAFIGAGGGIEVFNDGLFSIASSKLTGNVAHDGGGILTLATPNVTINNVVEAGNFAIDDGGGMSLLDATTLKVTGGSVTGNSATSGGGIYTAGSTGTITGITISGNAAAAGGGIFNTTSSLSLHLDKIVANSAATGPDFGGAGTFTFM